MRRLALAGIVCALPLLVVNATTIVQLQFSELCNSAAFIFEGYVTEITTSRDNSSIWTKVTLTIVDLIKGTTTGNEIELRFLGGTIGDVTMHVSEMRIPALGETGIYFVESLATTQANPLLGWSQGHFIVVEDLSGVKRIFTPDDKAVYAVETVLNAPQKQLSTGLALGVLVGDKKRFDPLGSEFFKSEIRDYLSNQNPKE